jgi:hypothetical protein
MKFQCAIAIAIALSASSAIALSIPSRAVDAPTTTTEQLYTIELAPGETKQVTEAQKWELHNVSLTAEFSQAVLISQGWSALHGHYRLRRASSSIE